MTVFDTLDELESYRSVFPAMDGIADVMDHSLPYDQGPGEYDAAGHDGLKYIIDTHLSSDKGFEAEKHEGKKVMEIVLEGEEMVSFSSSVFRLSPGRFLVYSGDESVRRGQCYASVSAFKSVRFIF
ncbi:MAG: hypothetical protein SPJ34_03665 [Candidatus Ornithospirochaeta sp.]|nr:hypothetical protein [Candidatus Ornithospirochaeta sp.]